jgi:hypothetical protein
MTGPTALDLPAVDPLPAATAPEARRAIAMRPNPEYRARAR